MMGRQTDGLRRLTAHNLPYNSLSTVRGQTGILVHVHPALPWNPKSQQPQLPRSEPDGQPTESSHLDRLNEKGRLFERSVLIDSDQTNNDLTRRLASSVECQIRAWRTITQAKDNAS
jgi:hypothetical protein